MLVEFRVANFRSFRDEQILSLVASKDDSLPDSCILTDRFNLLRTAAVYGPNASGKSNLIKAIDSMKSIVEESIKPGPFDVGSVSPFMLDSESSSKPTLFEVTIILDGVRYQYGFTRSRERVHEEWLFAAPTNQTQKWFRRGLDPNTGEATWKWSSFLRGERARLSKLTRPDALFLSVGAQFNHKQLLPIYSWFDKSLRTLPAPTSVTLRPITATFLTKLPDVDKAFSKSFRDLAVALMQQADLGISDINVEYDEESNRFDVKMFHPDRTTGDAIAFPLAEESDGTQRLFQLIGPWVEALTLGYTVFVDEIEASLHPLLTRELIRLFQNPRMNIKAAQLVFTTHDTTLLDPQLLRRDQVWFTEKNELGATALRPLSDYKKARKGEAMQKGYLAGRYGAVPILKAFEV